MLTEQISSPYLALDLSRQSRGKKKKVAGGGGVSGVPFGARPRSG